jgi:TldD protein
MPTHAPPELTAPFAPGGEAAIDAALAERLLAIALSSGGDAADLYFEFRVTASYALEEEKVKSVGRGVTLGLGVRVNQGDATGYAYTEELTWERMAHAARIAGQIASGGGRTQPVAVHAVALPDFYPVERTTLSEPPADKLALLYAADRAARAADSRVVKVDASLVEQIKEILVFTSDGRMARDVQPLMRFGVSVVAEGDGKRQGGSSGGGGRFGMEYFAQPGKDAASHGREAVRVAIAMLDARDAPAGEMPVVLAPGDSGILLHEAVGHGLEADFNRKETSNYSGQLGQVVASPLCTVIDDGTLASSRGSINVDDEGQPGGRHVLIERGVLVGYMHDRLSARHFGVAPGGNGRRESFREMPLPRMTNTLLMPGAPRPRRDHRLGQARHLRQAVQRRPGQHLQRRLRVQPDRELPDRGRQADRAAQGRQPDRQRPRGHAQGRHGRQRLPAVGRHLDLRQGRSVGAGRRRHPERPHRRHHRRREPRPRERDHQDRIHCP